ncbi:MAG: NUDIX domain-containing protein [Minisyncoccia bacterium]
MSKPIISIILGSYNRKPFLKKTIKTLRENGISLPYEIIVIDGGSSDGSISWLTSQKDIITIIQHNNGLWKGVEIEKRNWGYYMNIAFQATHGKYVVMISDDCLIVPESIMNAYYLFENQINSGKKIGGIAFYWRNLPHEKMYYVRQTLGHKLSINHGMYLKSALIDIGFCEEDKYPFYYGDGNLSLKLWDSNYIIIDCKTAFVEHFHFATMNVRQKNSNEKGVHKRAYMKNWTDIFYNENIDNQSGKIFLNFNDSHKTANLFKTSLKYYIGILQSKFGTLYGYERKRPDRLPSIEMLSNQLNIKYLISKFKINYDQLCFFALIKKDNKILMGLREYRKGAPVWTYPGGRAIEGETMIESIKREILEEIGVSNVNFLRVIGQKDGVKSGDKVYFIQCEINEEPKLIEHDKFKEWKWHEINDLPKNLIDPKDIKFIHRIF